MKVLVVGHRGQLGTELMRCLRSGETELGAVPAVFQNADVLGVDIDTLDITNGAKTEAFLTAERPDVILNCAGYTNVDGCESHPDEAYRANAQGPKNLAIAAETVGAKLVHISTDYVFRGDKTTPLRECDLPDPVSVYGRTKLAGEDFTRLYSTRAFIVRTAWMYGYTGKNFVKAIEKKARETGRVTVVNDQIGCPTNAADLVYHILKLAATEDYGVYHCTGNGKCSWYDFAKKIVAYAGISAVVSPCRSDEYPSPVKRPAYSVLDHTMLRVTVGDDMRRWDDALAAYYRHLREETK